MAQDFVGAGGGSKSSGNSQTNTPDNLLSQDSVEFILATGEGETVGPAEGLKSVYVGDTPIQNRDGSTNFQDFEVTIHPGLDAYNAPFITSKLGFGLAHNNQVGIALATDTPVTRQGEKSDIDFLEVRIVVQRLLTQNTSGVFNNTVQFKMEVKAISATDWSPFFPDNPVVSITGKTTSNYPKEFRRAVPRIAEPYEIRITKVSPINSTEHYADITWESFQEVDGKPRQFPDTALLHVKGKATDQLNSLPQIKTIWDGLIMRVPSNYDPIAKTYTGLWDGTWKKAWSTNPAYFLREVLLNDRWGWSAYRPVHVDDGDFYTAGQWCDQRVGAAQKPRYTINACFTDAMNGREFARYIAGTFNACIFDDDNGNILLRVDKTETPVALFTPEAIHNGQFEYSYSDMSVRYNDITIIFRNEELLYEEDRRRVRNDASIGLNGRIPLDFVAVGCTDAEEAVRRGYYKLLTALTETEFVSFKVNRRGAMLSVWEMIYIADPTMSYSLTGRVKTVVDNTITLRDPMTLVSGVQYRVKIQREGEIFDAAIISPAGQDLLELTLDAVVPSTPEKTVFSVYGSDVGTPKPFRVLKIEEPDGDPDNVAIYAVEVNANKFNDADNLVWSNEIDYQGWREAFILTPTGVGVKNNSIVNPDGTLFPRILVDWTPSRSRLVNGYEVQWASEDRATDWSPSVFSTGATNWVSIDIPHATMSYVARVRALSQAQGKTSEWSYSSNSATPGKDGVPDAPSGLVVKPGLAQMHLAWLLPGEPDIKYTEVWFNTVNVRPDPATHPELRAGIAYGDTFTHNNLSPDTQYWYWVRVVDRIDQKSLWNSDPGTTATTWEADPAGTAPDTPAGLVLATQIIRDANNEPMTALLASWVANTESDLSGYEIQVQGDGEAAIVYACPTNAWTGWVTAGKDYHVQVRAIDTFSNRSSWSSVVSIASAIIDDYPSAPTGLTASIVVGQWGTNTVQRKWTIDWDDNAASDRVTSYTVATHKSTGDVWREQSTSSSTLIFEELSGILGVEVYQVKVRAVSRTGKAGPWSDTVVATKTVDDVAPAAPTGLSASAGLRILTFTWTNPQDDRLNGVEVYISDTSTLPTTPTDIVYNGAYTINGLTQGTKKYVWVRSRNYAGQFSSFVGPVNATTGAITSQDFDAGAPATPVGLTLTQNSVTLADGSLSVRLNITWTANTENDLDGYELEVRDGITAGWPGNATTPVGISAGNTTAYALSVRPGFSYGVRIRAKDFIGQTSAWSPEVVFAASGDTVGPAKPSSVTTTSLFQAIRVDWTNPSDADFDRVRVWSNGSSDAATKVMTYEGRSSSFTHEVNATGTTRYYWLEALDVSGNNSGFTGPYSATTASLDASSFPTDLQPIKVVSVLPTGAPADGITTVRYNSRLYKWNGTAWVDELSAGNISGQLTNAQIADLAAAKLTGQVSSAQIADAAITTAKFASGITPVEVVAVLPTAGNFVGRMATLTSDGKLYRYTASGWSAAVPAGDIAGQLADAQVAAVSAGKVTGQLTNDQIADLAAAKLTGQLVASQIGSVAANTVTGQLTNDQIAALSAAKLTDQITSVQITDNAISTPKLSAGAVSADKIATSAVTADKIASNSVTTNALAAGSVTASKIVISPANICADPWFSDMSYWAPDVGGWFQEINDGGTNTPTTQALGSRSAILLWSGAFSGTGRVHVWKRDVPYSGSGRTLRLRARGLTDGTPQPINVGIQFYSQTSHLGSLGIAFPASPSRAVATKEAQMVVPDGTTTLHFVIYNEAGPAWTGIAAISDLELCEAASAAMIVNGAIVADKIATNAVVAGKIATDAVTSGTVAADAITSRELSAGSVVTEKLSAGAVAADKIAASAVTTDKLAANAVTAGKISADAVTAGTVAAGAISSREVAANSISARHLVISDFENLVPDNGFLDANSWVLSSDVTVAAPGRTPLAASSGWRGQTGYELRWYEANITSQPFTIIPGDKYRLGFQGWSNANDISIQLYLFNVETSEWALMGYWYPNGNLQDYAMTYTVSQTWRRVRLHLIRRGSNGTTDSQWATVTAPFCRRLNGGELIVDGAITADKVAANAVTADKIAANSVTASKVLIASNNYCLDPYFDDDQAWFPDASGWSFGYTAYLSDIRRVAKLETAIGGGRRHIWSRTFPIDCAGQPVRLRATGYNGSNQNVTIFVRWRRGDGVDISDLGIGWAAGSGYSTQETVGIAPADAAYAVFVLFNDSGTEFTGQAYIAVPQLQRRVDNSLIVEGGITADKLAANSVTTNALSAGAITTDKIAANAVTSTVIASNSIVSDKIAAGAVTTNHMTADTINGDRITTNTLHGTKVQAGTITGDRLALGFSKFDAIRVVGHSNNVTSGATTGVYINGVRRNDSLTRGLNAWAFNRADHSFVEARSWDLYGNYAGTAGDMMNWLNSQSDSRLIIIASYDAVQVQDDGLLAALKRIGASSAAKITFAERWPYVLIGWGGLGEGNGLEMRKANDSTVPAEVSTLWGDSTVIGINTTSGPYTTIEPGRILVAGTQGLDGYFNGTEIDGGKVKANSIQGDRIIAGTMSGDRISAGSLTVDKLAVFSSGNLLAGADLSAGMTYWVQSWNQGGANVQRGIDGPDASWVLVGGHTLYLHQSDEISGWYDVKYQHPNVNGLSDYVPVEPGKYVEFSAYTGVHRCTAHLLIIFDDADHNYIAEYVSSTNSGEAAGGRTLSAYKRLWVKIQVPANAASARIILRKAGTLAGQNDSWAFWTQPFFGYCAPNATEPQPWQPGGATAISGASITTGTLNADRIVAGTITGNLIGNAEVNSLQIAGNAVTVPSGFYQDWEVEVSTDAISFMGAGPIDPLSQPVAIHVSGICRITTGSNNQENNNIKYSVQRSKDGTTWETIASSLTAATSIGAPFTYSVDPTTHAANWYGVWLGYTTSMSVSFMDYTPGEGNVWYRVVVYKALNNTVQCYIGHRMIVVQGLRR